MKELGRTEERNLRMQKNRVATMRRMLGVGASEEEEEVVMQETASDHDFIMARIRSARNIARERGALLQGIMDRVEGPHRELLEDTVTQLRDLDRHDRELTEEDIKSLTEEFQNQRDVYRRSIRSKEIRSRSIEWMTAFISSTRVLLQVTKEYGCSTKGLSRHYAFRDKICEECKEMQQNIVHSSVGAILEHPLPDLPMLAGVHAWKHYGVLNDIIKRRLREAITYMGELVESGREALREQLRSTAAAAVQDGVGRFTIHPTTNDGRMG